MSLPTREDALALLKEHLTTPYLIKHSLASEAVLRGLARHLGEDEDLWGLTGLLHDLDLDGLGEDLSGHAIEGARLVAARFEGFPEEALQAIRCHNDANGIPCVSRLDHALAAGESITGLVFATQLVLPSKKLGDVKPKSVKKRIKEPRFAARVNRERIGHHAELGLDAAAFCQIAVDAMKGIEADL